jgi:allantoinase
MSDFDVIIRGGTVVTATGTREAVLGIVDGKIVAMADEITTSAKETIDAKGKHVFPGMIDAHVHFNDPGRADWEGFETGSRSIAAGGGTMFFDMPLNAHPPTIDRAAFEEKLNAAKGKSLVDFAFWGGLVPGNVEGLAELAECGVVGFKAFMSNSGIDNFACVDDATLRAGMKRAATLGLPVAVHAESETMTRRLAEECIAQGRTGARDYLGSRPIEAELEAIRRALDLAGETGCALHIVHVSCGDGVRLVRDAASRGVDVSCETCPHYLMLTKEDVEQIGALAKCAPPLRSRAVQQELWDCVLKQEITTIGSDHSPSPPGMKQADNFFKVWGGISGGQHTLSLLLTGLKERGRLEESSTANTLANLAKLISSNVAGRFRLPKGKGHLEIGCDADLALVNLDQSFLIKSDDLLYRHAQTPYAGRTLRGRVAQTLLRGQTVLRDGQVVSKPLGQLVKPDK